MVSGLATLPFLLEIQRSCETRYSDDQQKAKPLVFSMQVHTVDQTVLPGTIAKSFVGQSFASPLCPPAVLQVLPIYMVHVTVNSRVKSLRPLETGGSGGVTHTHTHTHTHRHTHTHMCARLLRCTSKHIYCSYAFIPPKL